MQGLLARTPKVVTLVALGLVVAGLAAVAVGATSQAVRKAPNTTVWFGGPPGLTDSTGARGAFDRAAGVKAGKAAGKKVKLPKIKVGSLNIVGSIVSAQRLEAGLKKAVDTLGWQWVRCDAQGDPAKMEACGQSLLTQGVDVIYNMAIEPSIINGTLLRAKKMGVPVIVYGGLVTPSKLQRNYTPDEAGQGRILADYMVKQVGKLPGTKPVEIWTFPALSNVRRTDQIQARLKSHSDIVVKHVSTIDGADPVGATRAGVAAQLTQTPDLKGLWVSFDAAAFGAAQAIDAVYGGKKFPNRPCVYTFHADQPNLGAMRKGEICALADTAYDNVGWIAVDQTAEWFARHRAMSPSPTGGYKGVDFMPPILVTPTVNLPPVGKFIQGKDSGPTFFKAKWATEFTK
jgi:ABC-type sugar transport system substrate-binding protein